MRSPGAAGLRPLLLIPERCLSISESWRWAPQLGADCPEEGLFFCVGRHGIMNYGWWNLIARLGVAPLLDGLRLVMCMAPAVQWYPIYGEIFEDRRDPPRSRLVPRRCCRDLTVSRHDLAVISP